MKSAHVAEKRHRIALGSTHREFTVIEVYLLNNRILSTSAKSYFVFAKSYEKPCLSLGSYQNGKSVLKPLDQRVNIRLGVEP